eukprot:3441895-Rhodomonas_salina.2
MPQPTQIAYAATICGTEIWRILLPPEIACAALLCGTEIAYTSALEAVLTLEAVLISGISKETAAAAAKVLASILGGGSKKSEFGNWGKLTQKQEQEQEEE